MKVLFRSITGGYEEFLAADAPEALFKLREMLGRTLHKEFYRPIAFYVEGAGFDILPLRFGEAAEAERDGDPYFFSADICLPFMSRGRLSGLSAPIGTVEVSA